MSKNNKNNNEDFRKEILGELVVKEEDEREKLKDWVSKSKPLFKIEESGKILLSVDFPFTNAEKILLTLIGKYFATDLKLISNKFMTTKELSRNLGIVSTTLSAPLSNLASTDLIEKDGRSYGIRYYQIEKVLNEIHGRYIEKKGGEKFYTQQISKRKISKKTKTEKKGKTKKTISYPRVKDEKVVPRILKTEGVEKLAKDSRISSDELDTLFDFDDDGFKLVRKIKGSTKEIHLKSVILYLTAYKYCYGFDEVPSGELRSQLVNFGIPRSVALSTSLKEYKTYIIHKKGPRGSTKTSYKLSFLGLKEGTNLIHDIIKGTKEFFLSSDVEKAAPSIPEKIDIKESLETFAKTLKTEVDKLREIFDFQDNYVRFYEPPEEKTRKKTQVTALVQLATIMHEVYKIKIIDAVELLDKNHIVSGRLDLLYPVKNKEFHKFFTGKKRNLKITWFGIKEGRQRIKGHL